MAGFCRGHPRLCPAEKSKDVDHRDPPAPKVSAGCSLLRRRSFSEGGKRGDDAFCAKTMALQGLHDTNVAAKSFKAHKEFLFETAP